MASTATLHNGHTIPLVGLGTWKSKPGEVGQAVKTALLEGKYKHIDCAAIYGNETEVGQALKEAFETEGGPKREEIFVTSKLWNTNHARDAVRPALEKTLSDLGLQYLDLYLIHWPVAFAGGKDDDGSFKLAPISLRETWEAMEALVDAGLVRSIGVSNFNVQLLVDLLTYARIKPAVNQVEIHPYLPQPQLLAFCNKHNIHVTAYSPLGSSDSPLRKADDPVVLNDATVASIASKYNKSSGAILLKYSEQRGISVIPKSVNRDRIVANNSISDFTLSQEDLDTLNNLPIKVRTADPNSWAKIPLFG